MKNKLTILTGANGQVGSFIAHQLAEKNESLLLLYHKNFNRIEDLTNKEKVMLISCNLEKLEDVNTAIHYAADNLAAVPAFLIHTAAIRSYDAMPLAQTNPETFKEVLNSNLEMAYNVLRTCLPFMLQERFGRIVMFGSNVVQTGLYRGSAYAAAKAAIVNLVKSIALETASANVLINAISPAPVQTVLEEEYTGDYLAFRKRYFEEFRQMSPTGKLVSKEEIWLFCNLLLSEKLENFTGKDIIIDGGFSAIQQIKGSEIQ
ncbi:SDR family oxidoreductase [Candidatus Syntrophosphaera thermopropionivorans]|uniref:SDR family oxidoreductase n=1 Tax=Candidatus Syntrophosphaera thermopropionivorans TaxID=2593015 RepID=A0AC61QIL6_9BACT|nr:SDR family oxidoreductase [Candidatus Syntrophosphaera thermopropionivorans]TDF72798.1 SDR family oxidoreductase [Candidatus Syntrophosphaera thermopropionivorans]